MTRKGYANTPVPPKRPHVVSIHGDQVIDNYFWMRERDNPEVIAHLEAENRYTEEMTAHIAGLRERLYSEMRSRLREEDESVPDRYGPFVYFTRTQAGRQYPIVYRRPVHNAQEEISSTSTPWRKDTPSPVSGSFDRRTMDACSPGRSM